MEERFCRNIPAITPEQQRKLADSRVCVVGCGGLGGYIIEYLTRLGIGHLTAADGDTFEESNRNRQILATRDNLGLSKAAAAAVRAESIAPGVDIRVVREYLNEINAPQLLRDADVVMDALDSAAARRVLAKVCREMELPLIHGAISGWSAQIAVCMPGGRAMETLFSDSAESADKSCLSFTPALCAAIQCAEAVKLLTGEPIALGERLLVADLRTMEFETIRLSE